MPDPTRASENDPIRPAPLTQSLHAPWRLAYLETLAPDAAAAKKPSSGSFLRDYWLNPAGDIANHVVLRTDAGMILLNAFPYANGHLLVALGEPRPTLMDYDPPQRAALWALVDLASELMQSALNPQGINIGVNQGRAAGAGVPQHLHAHLVPRWSGDVNFMAVVGQVRVIPAALEHMARRYRQTWALMRSRGAG